MLHFIWVFFLYNLKKKYREETFITVQKEHSNAHELFVNVPFYKGPNLSMWCLSPKSNTGQQGLGR